MSISSPAGGERGANHLIQWKKSENCNLTEAVLFKRGRTKREGFPKGKSRRKIGRPGGEKNQKKKKKGRKKKQKKKKKKKGKNPSPSWEERGKVQYNALILRLWTLRGESGEIFLLLCLWTILEKGRFYRDLKKGGKSWST